MSLALPDTFALLPPPEEDHGVVTGPLGIAEVWLTLNDQDYQHVGEVRYFSVLLEEVRPEGGPSGGGTLVTLRGWGFDGVVSPSAGVMPLRRTARCLFRFRVPEGSGSVNAGTGAAGYLAGGRDGLGSEWPAEWEVQAPVLSRGAHEIRCVTPRAPAEGCVFRRCVVKRGVESLRSESTLNSKSSQMACSIENACG